MQDKVNVHMGEYKIAEAPIILQSIGLGSCVGVCLYDKSKKTGGLAHIMSANSKKKKEEVNPHRFADLAIDALIKDMKEKGCKKTFLSAKIFGGASMFPGVMTLSNIGEDNVIAVKQKLKKLNIKIVAEDTGGSKGRSIWFDTTDGSVVVSQIKGETKMM